MIAELAGFLAQTAQVFRVFAHGLVPVHAGVDRVAIYGGLHAFASTRHPLALGVLPALFGANTVGLSVLRRASSSPLVVRSVMRFRPSSVAAYAVNTPPRCARGWCEQNG